MEQRHGQEDSVRRAATEHSAHAIAFAAELAKATGAELTLLAVNELMTGYGHKGDVATHVWDDAELKGILDIGVAAAKKAGVAAAKTAGATSRDAARACHVRRGRGHRPHRCWNRRQGWCETFDARVGLTRRRFSRALPCNCGALVADNWYIAATK